MSTRAVAQRVRELLELALLLLLGAQFLLGRVRGRLHARRALRLEGLGALGLCRSQCRTDGVIVYIYTLFINVARERQTLRRR